MGLSSKDIAKLEMWSPLQDLLTASESSAEISTQVLWIIGTALQNNPKAQLAVSSPQFNDELRGVARRCPFINRHAFPLRMQFICLCLINGYSMFMFCVAVYEPVSPRAADNCRLLERISELRTTIESDLCAFGAAETQQEGSR